MDKWQGLQSFWESFGIPAYDENSVPPDDAEMPYITYSASVGPFESVIPLSASVWYRGTSWVDISNKVDEISRRLSNLIIVELGNGRYIALSKANGSQFAQRMSDETNDLVKRVYITITGEFLTEH